MNRPSKRFILYGLGILLVIATVAGIAVMSGRSSATGNTARLAGAGIESLPRTVARIKSMPGRATSGCGVGGAPAMKTNRVNGQMGDLVAGPIVVGCGRRNQELIQLVAFRTTKQLCAEMERPRMEMIVGGACKPVDIAWHDYCAELCIASVLPADMGRNHRYKFATLFGEASRNRRTSRLCCMSQRGRERFLRSRVVLSRLTCSKLSTRPNRSSSLARLFDLACRRKMWKLLRRAKVVSSDVME